MNDLSEQNHLARDHAYSAIAELVVEPTGIVEYQSNGRLLVIGHAPLLDQLEHFAEPLQVNVLLQEEGVPSAANVIMAGRRAISITGHMGHFEVIVDPDANNNRQVLSADLILDTNRLALLTMEILPPGYLSCKPDPEAIKAAAEELHELIGTFEKPRYFDYDTNICAHSRSGVTGCTRCLDACPAQAITSIRDAVQVDPYLCQGGGACATVCPTGAITYRYPAAQDTLTQIRTLIKTYQKSGGSQPVLLLCAEADNEQLTDLPDNCLQLSLEELASVGFEAWLSALAYGAASVVLYDGGSVPASVGLELQQQLQMSREIISGIGYPSEVLQLCRSVDAIDHVAAMPAISPATFAPLENKRTVAYLAIDHLIQQAADVQEVVRLSAGAPFGRISVDHETCTLCMACTSVCPASAVTAGNGVPRLNFQQSACVQCGMCARACPEQAITLQAELITDAAQRSGIQVINEDQPFCCINCGKAFATRSVIDVILGKLQGHPMFQGEREKNRLRMCEDCRVVDMIEDPDGELMQ